MKMILIVRTITKALPIIKWTEAFQDFLHRVIGARMIPLAYVIRTNPQVPRHCSSHTLHQISHTQQNMAQWRMSS